MTKLQVIENPKTVEEYLANIDKRLERITQLLSAALGVLLISHYSPYFLPLALPLNKSH